MKIKPVPDVSKYLIRLPHIWCGGCGNGIVVGSMMRSLEELEIDQSQVAVVSGIGCSGRAGSFLKLCGFQPPHGRALSAATGVKLGNPKLHVIVLAGDGDTLSIGGNHFLHACRRNIDITLVLFNNFNYGMTGGQHAPTTPMGAKTTTTPYGSMENSFDALDVARISGATYLARGSISNPRQLTKLMAKAINHKGFSVIEAMTVCPTLFGRFNKLGGANEMIETLKEKLVPVEKTVNMEPSELKDKIISGELYVRENALEYTDMVRQVVHKAQKGREKA